MAITTIKIIEEFVKRKIVLYKPAIQNIGVTNNIDIKNTKIFTSSIIINCSSLK